MSIPTLTAAGKVALVTGGGTGLGRAFALSFAEAGADVAICDQTDQRGELGAVADEIRKTGQRAVAIKADVSRKVDVENMVKKTVAQLGGIDILINNAGVVIYGSLLEAEEYAWDKVIDVNLKGPFLCSQAVSKIMIKRKGGNIINISSTDGFEASPHETAYCVSKAGLIMLTRVLARELASYNIRVNAIAPWVVRTPMAEAFLVDSERTKAALATVPCGRIGETNDIIGAALFLASDAASWITGHTIVVDGGHLA